MRMWNVNPKLLCQKHLCGEHLETHMFYGTLKKKISVKGYLEKGLLEIHNLRIRHNILAEEMNNRGYKHNSEFPNDFIPYECGKVNIEDNIRILKEKCPECKKRIEKGE